MQADATMTRKVIAVPPEFTLPAAYQLMLTHRIRHLPVVQGGRLVGMLSDRDALLRAQPGAFDSDDAIVPEVSVAEAMTMVPIVCSPDTCVSWLAQTMIEAKIDAVPVVSEGRLLGLVTSSDLLALLVDRDEAKILPFEFKLEMISGLDSAAA